jgi:hypothetical protein
MHKSLHHQPLVFLQVTTEDHTSGWTKQKESISADPKGLVFSHYKAGATNDLISQFNVTLHLLTNQHAILLQKFGSR